MSGSGLATKETRLRQVRGFLGGKGAETRGLGGEDGWVALGEPGDQALGCFCIRWERLNVGSCRREKEDARESQIKC